MEQWAAGNFTAETIDATVQLNADAIGRADALQQAVEWILGEDE